MKAKNLLLVVLCVLALVCFAACSDNSGANNEGNDAAGETVTLTVAASPTPHAEILNAAADLLAEQGIELKVIEYTDYVQPNMVTESGEVDANYFQHLPYLEQFNEENGTSLVSVAAIHYEPFGLYPGKTAAIADLPDGAKIAVPNDGTNEARALLLLQQEGLITLKDGAGLNATKLDIVENAKNLDIVEMEAAQLPRTLADVDMAVINGNYAIEAGLVVGEDAVAVEDVESEAAQTYANIICVKAGNENNEAVQALVAALQSDTIRDFINDKYAGAVVPMF
ncbi:MAG: MetQ/NlpA family ABC transporter substrate-binding protein [Firmicutes bacterium]|nr:MetQ/NlpA family ABC transporter substrate-binding protein [Bacillota bacterium]